jgi:hypothetical protein
MGEEKKYDVNDVKKILALLIEIGNVGATKDWTQIIRLADEIFALQSVDWKDLIPSIKDIDAEEMKEIEAFFVEKFELPEEHKNIEEIIESSLSAALKLVEVVMDVINIVKNAKAK